MKWAVCDICDDRVDLNSLKDVEGWLLSTENNPDLCPTCYDDVYKFIVNVRKKYIESKRKKFKQSRVPLSIFKH